MFSAYNHHLVLPASETITIKWTQALPKKLCQDRTVTPQIRYHHHRSVTRPHQPLGHGLTLMTVSSRECSCTICQWTVSCFLTAKVEINQDQYKLMKAEEPPIPDVCNHKECNDCWKEYPGSRFPNWTDSQVKKSKIAEAITRESKKTCVCHRVDIDNQGHFRNADTVNAEPGLETETWQSFLTTGVRTASCLPGYTNEPFIAPVMVKNKGHIC